MNAIKERTEQWSKPRLQFENEAMDFYLSWFLGYCAHGGAEYGECMRVASQIEDGNPHSWAEAWRRMARHVEGVAMTTIAAGHLVSAREEYLRASNYYRAALVFMRPKDPSFIDTWEDMRSCFRMASALFLTPIQHVEVPYEGKTLPGYFMRVDSTRMKRPTLIAVGGGDAFAEDLYFWAAAPGAARGYNTLFVELPGQGSTPLNGLSFRPDAEVPLKAVVDYAVSLPEVDRNRLYLYGESGGGYMAARAAAYDRRIKACVLNAPVTGLYSLVNAELSDVASRLQSQEHSGQTLGLITGFSVPVVEIMLDKLCWQMGASSVSSTLDHVKTAHLGDLVSKIECPTLCLVSEGGRALQNEQAREFYNALNAPKQMRTFTQDEGAEAQCEVNNLGLMQATLFNWLDEL